MAMVTPQAPVIYEEFVTLGQNSCGRCRAQNGKVYKKGEGPKPPLHYGCQCMRVTHHVEYVEQAASRQGDKVTR